MPYELLEMSRRVPWRYVCDGKTDSIDSHDEKDCSDYICKGLFHCRRQTFCIHQAEACDGVGHCPENEDKINCQIPECVKECTCQGKAYRCTGAFIKELLFYYKQEMEIKYLDISNNTFVSVPEQFLMLSRLLFLNLSLNRVKALQGAFQHQAHWLHLIYLITCSNISKKHFSLAYQI